VPPHITGGDKIKHLSLISMVHALQSFEWNFFCEK